LSQANEAFVGEDYKEAVKLYTKAISLNSDCADHYSKRSHAHIKLDNYKEASDDAGKAIEIGTQDGKVYLRKGIALYHLQDYSNAKCILEEGQHKSGGSDSNISSWIEKCVSQLRIGGENSTDTNINLPETVPKIRHDWYQTDSHVVLTILIKNARQDDVKVQFSDNTMSCIVRLPEDREYSLGLELQNNIIPTRSAYKLLSSKIEVKMQKADGIRWTKLEAGEERASSIKQFKPAEGGGAPCVRNWDKIVTDLTKEDEEKGEGDAAINQLFQKIYAEGTDEVKMAMNKSFMESGGTVLSTNWKEVGKDKVPIKPPDGMEWKNWEN